MSYAGDIDVPDEPAVWGGGTLDSYLAALLVSEMVTL